MYDAFNALNFGLPFSCDVRVAGDSALTGMHYSRFGTFAAFNFAGYESNAAGAAVAGAAIVRQVDTTFQCRIQQQLAIGGHETLAVNRYLVMNCQWMIPCRVFFQVSSANMVCFAATIWREGDACRSSLY